MLAIIASYTFPLVYTASTASPTRQTFGSTGAAAVFMTEVLITGAAVVTGGAVVDAVSPEIYTCKNEKHKKEYVWMQIEA